jgi:hypothetical protein
MRRYVLARKLRQPTHFLRPILPTAIAPPSWDSNGADENRPRNHTYRANTRTRAKRRIPTVPAGDYCTSNCVEIAMGHDPATRDCTPGIAQSGTIIPA